MEEYSSMVGSFETMLFVAHLDFTLNIVGLKVGLDLRMELMPYYNQSHCLKLLLQIAILPHISIDLFDFERITLIGMNA